MALKDIFQTDDEQIAEFAVPADVYPGADGAVVVLRIPTPREALDLADNGLDGIDAENAMIEALLKEIRLGSDTLPAADIDLDRVPLPLWRFINTCAAGVGTHGRQQAGEALRGWRKQQSAAVTSEAATSTSPTSLKPKR